MIATAAAHETAKAPAAHERDLRQCDIPVPADPQGAALELSALPACFRPAGADAAREPREHEKDLRAWDRRIEKEREGRFDGQRVALRKNVFPSCFGATSRDIDMALHELQHQYERIGRRGPKVVLDMGCGDASLSRTLGAMDTVKKVVAVDNHPPAVKSARENVRRGGLGRKIKVYRSDLLKDIRGRLPLITGRRRPTFDLVVFNHPYYPRAGKPKFGMGTDGGRKIIRRFFAEIASCTHTRTEIIMPYSSNVRGEHNPARIARRFGYQAACIRERRDRDGVYHQVYRFVKKDPFHGQFPSCFVRDKLKDPESRCAQAA